MSTSDTSSPKGGADNRPSESGPQKLRETIQKAHPEEPKPKPRTRRRRAQRRTDPKRTTYNDT